jgi:peptidoglycan DL-endopeptidase CwlO
MIFKDMGNSERRKELALVCFTASALAASGVWAPAAAGMKMEVSAAETEDSTSQEDPSAQNTESEPAAEEEENVRTLYASSGFDYAFSAHKVSLQDVGEECGAEETPLTPVQVKEQNVVNAVSKTQGIQMDRALATILSATAVTVVSDANIAVQMAQMADRRQTQMKLDQGVITPQEAEALLDAVEQNQSLGNATITISGGEGDGSDSAEEETAEASSETSAVNADGEELVVAQVNDYINVRADADVESDVVGKLYNKSVAKVLGRTGNGWVRIQSGDVTGYIREEYVATGSAARELADSVSVKQAVVTTQTLRVRAAALADSDVITLIGEGETLEILEEENGWYKVSTEDGEGYISSDFADVEEIYPEAISKEQEEAEKAAKEAEEAAKEQAAADSEKKTSSKSSDSLNTYTGSSQGSTSGQAVANYALQFVGNPYVWGGSSLTNGTDCSGFTMAVYANFGVSLPHYTGAQQSCGTAVSSLSEAQPGDLILYSGHVAIYLGNNKIVHASNPRSGITTGTATYRNIVAIRRILN